MNVSSNQPRFLEKHRNNHYLGGKEKDYSNIDNNGLLFIVILSSVIFIVIFLSIFMDYGIMRGLAGATGAGLSTFIGFRWVWSKRYGWEQYLVSIRPIFLSITFIFLILGPLPTLLGAPKYLQNRGVVNLYWLLYLVTPLAFLSYEYGYELGLGRLRHRIELPDFQKVFLFPGGMMLGLFAIVGTIYYYMAENIGFSGAGFGEEMMKRGEIVKGMGLLFNGLVAAVIANAYQNFTKKDLGNKCISLITVIGVFVLITLMHSRTRSIIIILVLLSLIQLSKKIEIIKLVIVSILLLAVFYFATTAIRKTLPADLLSPGAAVTDRLDFARQALAAREGRTAAMASLELDIGYRVDGFDLSAAILDRQDYLDIPYMWGMEFLAGIYQAVPAIIAPFSKADMQPKQVIIDHFQLEQFDQATNLFSTALADAGILGIPILFLAYGFFHACLWRYFALPKRSGIIHSATKCSYFAIFPSLLMFDQYSGSYFALTIQSWLLFTIIFSILIAIYATLSVNKNGF